MRFTLEPGNWYAAEILGEEFEPKIRSLSPIRINQIESKKMKNRILEIDFYHANYPEGVRDKQYRLKTLERNTQFYLGRSSDHNPARLLLIYQITADWLRLNFRANITDRDNVDEWLERNV